MKHRIEVDGVQSLVFAGHKLLGEATFLLLRFGEPAAAQRWLSGLPVSKGLDDDRREAVHLAFTWDGLAAIGLEEDALDEFPFEFREGMGGDAHRSRILGDVGEDAPEHWEWGRPEETLHALLLLYACDAAMLGEIEARERARLEAAGIEIVRRLDSRTNLDADGRLREHFGFVDGLSNPVLRHDLHARLPYLPPLLQRRRDADVIAPGEILLGYPNEFQVTPESPTLSGALDPERKLLVKDGMKSRRDVGHGGTYLVFRQLEQDVHGFWSFLAAAAPSVEERIRLGSKLVGRRPDGAPLSDGADPRDFDFAAVDPDGLHCPIGSHIRRVNPRDSLREKREDAIQLVKHHRLLRRGRSYGPPLDPSMLPERFLEAAPDGQRRGLHFICLNANIARQFEFVQQSWINNPDFSGVWNEIDPIAGQAGDTPRSFTIQRSPLRRRLHDLPRFVRMRGGAYFFLPGMRLLRYLART